MYQNENFQNERYQYENFPSRQDDSATTQVGAVPTDNWNTLYPVTGLNGVMAFTMANKPTGMLYPFPGVDAISCTSMFGEQASNKAAMAYRFFCRFLQYDITQGYNYVVNSPSLTR